MNNSIEYLKKYLPSDKLEEGIKLLNKGIPVQYIVGNVEFYNSIIKVDNRVLIPRFETELLVEKLIKYIKLNFNDKINILDMCTGSGCIAISLKKEIDCNMDAVDISNDALNVARDNMINNYVDINFILSDLFTNVKNKYDVIVSNPPYISYDEEIDEIVKNNEPSISLYASDNGLYFYEEILKNIKSYLNDRYIIAFEIGMNQGNDIKNIIDKYFNDVTISIEKDYNDRDRFIFIIKK